MFFALDLLFYKEKCSHIVTISNNFIFLIWYETMNRMYYVCISKLFYKTIQIQQNSTNDTQILLFWRVYCICLHYHKFFVQKLSIRKNQYSMTALTVDVFFHSHSHIHLSCVSELIWFSFWWASWCIKMSKRIKVAKITRISQTFRLDIVNLRVNKPKSFTCHCHYHDFNNL